MNTLVVTTYWAPVVPCAWVPTLPAVSRGNGNTGNLPQPTPGPGIH